MIIINSNLRRRCLLRKGNFHCQYELGLIAHCLLFWLFVFPRHYWPHSEATRGTFCRVLTSETNAMVRNAHPTSSSTGWQNICSKIYLTSWEIQLFDACGFPLRIARKPSRMHARTCWSTHCLIGHDFRNPTFANVRLIITFIRSILASGSLLGAIEEIYS